MATESIKPVAHTPPQIERRMPVRQDPAAPAQAKEPEPPPRVDRAPEPELEAVVSELNEYVQIVQRDLRFSVDARTGRTVVTVLDAETEEVIRQIPPEEALSLARLLQGDKGEALRGLLLTARA